MYVVTFLTGLAVIGLVVEMIHYIDRTNRDIASFLLSMRHDDFSTSFNSTRMGRSFRELYGSFNEITEVFQRIRAEKETNFQYLQTVVKHVNVGLLCFEENGEVQLMNRTLQQLLNKPYLTHIHALEKIAPELLEGVRTLQPGERELVKVTLQGEVHQLAMRAVEFKLQDTPYKLISMQDIQGELEVNELEAWQKLIRILTHEIMNSVSPIVSLTATIQDMLQEDEVADSESITDMRDAVGAINKRSQGLLHFTEAYRDLTRVPVPQLQTISAKELLEGLEVLFRANLDEKGVKMDLHLPAKDFSFQADPELLEQVLINLIKNALDALEGLPLATVSLAAQMNEQGKTQLTVSDNGPGISPELLEQIFVPFFTTKGTGSGIGLSLSRQIMRRHKGSLSVQSVPGRTTFTVQL